MLLFVQKIDYGVTQMNYKILIAVSEAEIREHLMKILGADYSYLFAENGAELIGMLSSGIAADIVLLGINMPVMNGFEVLEIMNKRRWIEETPVIVLSPEIASDSRRKAYELGASAYVHPFSELEVRHFVENTLTLYLKQRQLVQLVENQVYEREKINTAMINIFSHVVELRNNEAGSHTLHMRTISELLLRHLVKISDRYKLSEIDISNITTLSALHDIGKIAIPEEILNKPGKLTAEEWEIMKTHTTCGDKMLYSAPVMQNDVLVKTAHEICRWHHERWDGGGYPDGLKGDEIPISAQVVAIADVYDALTSERCYKKAYSHEHAIYMICNGECGQFNPLMISCLKEVEQELGSKMKANDKRFDYVHEAHRLAAEMLSSMKLPFDDRSQRLFINEETKKEFFKQQAGGVQFEYDAVLQKVIYRNRYESNPVDTILMLNDGDDISLLSPEDWNRFIKKLTQTTREHPYTEMDVLIPVNGTYRWHRLTARTVWPVRGAEYISALGQFTDIHDKITNAGLRNVLKNGESLEWVYKTMTRLFDIVRIVDPHTSCVLKMTEGGELIKTDEKCFGIWGRCDCCSTCTSLRALSEKTWLTKLEVMDGRLYSVISKKIKAADRDCVIEIAFCVNDSIEAAEQNHIPERANLLFLDFYRDALTNAYSRMYLEDFRDNFENADAVAVIDVDGFKQINDVYGHPAGDVVLKHISGTIISSVRDNDVIIRYGGDEFLIIFNDVSEMAFLGYMEKIKKNVAASRAPKYPRLELSVSIGGAYGCKPFAKAIEQADREMYKNKKQF